jgi:O-antigen/teichoic acid export membrane protein
MTGPSKPLKHQAISGSRWAILARTLRALLGLLTVSILSRFLGPEDFGVFAMVLFVTSFAQIFADFGTRLALIQRPEVTPLEMTSVFWSNIVSASLLIALLYATAPLLSQTMFQSDALTQPLRWALPVFFFAALQGVSLSVLERKFAFSRVAISDFLGSLAGAAAAISLAFVGYGVGALVAQQVVGIAVVTLLTMWAARWVPGLRFSYAALKPLLRYGSYISLATSTQFVSSSLDRPIIATRLSAADLGFSAMSQQIVLTPLRMVGMAVRRVMFPIMASIQNDNVRLRRAFLGAQHGLMLVMAPVCLGIWALATPLVAVLLGPEWSIVATLLGFMTLNALSSTVNEFNGGVFSAKGHARFQFRWSMMTAVLTLIVLLASVPYGLVALVASRTALLVMLMPLNTYFAMKLIGQPWGEFLSAVIRPVISAAVMAGVVWAADSALGRLGMDALLRLVIGIPLGGLVYLGCQMVIDRSPTLTILRTVLRRERK